VDIGEHGVPGVAVGLPKADFRGNGEGIFIPHANTRARLFSPWEPGDLIASNFWFPKDPTVRIEACAPNNLVVRGRRDEKIRKAGASSNLDRTLCKCPDRVHQLSQHGLGA
jgi:hypothetical protein